MRLLLSSLISLLLFATSAQAYNDYYMDSFSTSNWTSGYGWQTCAGYSGAKPCISNGSYFSSDGVSSGDVVFAYTSYTIYDTIGTTHDMRINTGDNYLAVDMMTGPRNDEQGNKTEYVTITVQKLNSTQQVVGTSTFNESITNTSMETYAYDIGSLSGILFVKVTISGKDGGFWAGNYGAVIGAGSVYFTDTDPTAVVAPSYSSSISSAQTQDITDARGVTHSGNGIYITQIGDNLDLDIVQEGQDNFIAGTSTTVLSFSNAEIAGNYNTVDIEQRSDDNGLLFDLDGNHNNLTVSQGNSVSDGGGNRAIVGINGDYNDVSLTQKNGGLQNGQFADISVTGDSNFISSQQHNSDQMLFVDITGNDSTLYTNQKDSGSHFLDITLGSDQTLSVTQEGSGDHAATIALDGYESSLQLNQNSSTSQTYSIDQTCGNANGCSTTVVTQY